MNEKKKRKRYFPGGNPCGSCVHREGCDEICWHRAKWWDVQMALLRERLKGEKRGLEA